MFHVNSICIMKMVHNMFCIKDVLANYNRANESREDKLYKEKEDWKLVEVAFERARAIASRAEAATSQAEATLKKAEKDRG
ncbi:hypothetical protein COCNU_scaffold136715G000020 [Cocos nucifera]|nr:hypothetical protein [Cocos nucifera]